MSHDASLRAAIWAALQPKLHAAGYSPDATPLIWDDFKGAVEGSVPAAPDPDGDLPVLVEKVHRALLNEDPCLCGQWENENTSCPACGASIAGQQAFAKILARLGVDADGEPLELGDDIPAPQQPTEDVPY